MDTITQGLLGALSAQLGFRRRLGRSATIAAMLTAVAPDLDIFAPRLLRSFGLAVGPMASQIHHRSITHSLLFVPILAGLAAGIWWLFRRKEFRWLYLCCFVAALTHPLLDMVTSYGTQLLAPLSRHRFALDGVAVIDVLYTGILIVALLASWIARLRRGNQSVAAVRVAWVGMLILCAYLGAGLAMRQQAVARVRAALGQSPATTASQVASAAPGGIAPQTLAPADVAKQRQVNAYPMIGTIFLWRATVESPDGWQVAKVNLLFGEPIRFTPADTDEDRFVRAALAHPTVQQFTWFAKGQVRPVSHLVDGRRVVDIHDMRYGLGAGSADSLWFVRAYFDNGTTVAQVRLMHSAGRRSENASARSLLRFLWRDLTTPHAIGMR